MTLPRVYFIGDSISLHYGPYLERYLRGKFLYSRKEGEQEALLNLDRPQGANGGDSSMVLAFLRALPASGRPAADLFLINCGLHDIKTNPRTRQRQIPLGMYRRNLRAIAALCRARSVAWAWIRSTPVVDAVHNKPGMEFFRYARDLDAYNAAADGVMADEGVAVIDLCAFTRNLGADLFCDHAHFREPIRERQAAFLAGWLEHWRAGRGR